MPIHSEIRDYILILSREHSQEWSLVDTVKRQYPSIDVSIYDSPETALIARANLIIQDVYLYGSFSGKIIGDHSWYDVNGASLDFVKNNVVGHVAFWGKPIAGSYDKVEQIAGQIVQWIDVLSQPKIKEMFHQARKSQIPIGEASNIIQAIIKIDLNGYSITSKEDSIWTNGTTSMVFGRRFNLKDTTSNYLSIDIAKLENRDAAEIIGLDRHKLTLYGYWIENPDKPIFRKVPTWLNKTDSSAVFTKDNYAVHIYQHTIANSIDTILFSRLIPAIANKIAESQGLSNEKDIRFNQNKYPTSIEQLQLPYQVTSSGFDMKTNWSPDGEYIAFLTSEYSYKPYVAAVENELWCVQEDGFYLHPLIRNKDFVNKTVWETSWLSDSKHILSQIRNGGSEIWVTDLDGNIKRISPVGKYAEFPKCSPNTLKYVYSIRGPIYKIGKGDLWNSSIYIGSLDGSEKPLVNEEPINDFAWKNDSKSIIYSRYDTTNNNHDLWKVTIDNGKKRQITNTPDNELHPSYSSDGKYIAYDSNQAVYITPSHEFKQQLILENAVHPRWIPNANLLCVIKVQKNKYGSSWLKSLIINLDGKIIKEIPVNYPNMISFSPDGRYCVYHSNTGLWIDKVQ
jgi:Tol biopolymer transport system component